MVNHATAPLAAIDRPRVVLSSLGRGETIMTGRALSLKLCLEGEELYHVDGRTYRLSPGRLLLVDRGEAYEATLRAPSRGLCIYLPSASTTPAQAQLLGRTAIRSLMSTQTGVDLANAAARAHRHPEDWETHAPALAAAAAAVLQGAREDASAHIQQLNLKRAVTRREILNRLEMARAHLHAITSRNVPLSELADVAGLSSFHLSRYFSAVFGAPPVSYHRKLRMQLAMNMLKSGNHSATEVSLLLGFSDLSAFSHAFKKEFHVPPSLA
jgi:AraC family transcriptional regulator